MLIKTFYASKFPENCYAAILDGGIFLVDPGEFTSELENFVKENSADIKYILLTHMHFDHIRGVAAVKKLCSDAKIVIHFLDAKGLSDSSLSLAYLFGFEQEKIYADVTCKDEEVIKLGSTEIKIIHTPGHTEGGVCYMVEDVIFCGDTVFEGSCGRTDFPGGSGIVLAESLKKLKDIKGDYTLYPGHGNATTLNNERLYNPYMRNL